jgi:hypothetical protein
VANLLEFALGGKPMLADATASLPTVSANASTLSLTYKRVRPVEIIYSVQTTTDLAGTPVWTPEGVNQGTPAGDGTTTATVPLSTDRRFLRLGVSLAP